MKTLSTHINEQFNNLTQKQEDNIYASVVKHFEKLHGEATDIQSHFVTNNYNYFRICTDGNNEFTVDFKTLKGKLIKSSIIIKKL